MQTNNLIIGKKIAFATIAVIGFFLTIEMAARTYHYIKYNDPTGFLYGRRFINEVIQGVTKPREANLYGYLDSRKEADRVFAERHIRDVSMKIDTPKKSIFFGYPAYINKFGLRNRDIQLTKNTHVIRIMALGGSFVAGVGVEDAKTWESLLDEELKKLPGRYEVINAGGLGSNIDAVLVSLIDTIAKFRPDYLIIFSAYNNHCLLKQEKKLSLTWKLSSFFYNVSLFYAMLREKLSLLLYKDNNYYLYNYNISVSKPEVDNLMERYRKRLEQIYTVCGENGIDLILGLQPEFIPAGLMNLQNLLDEREIAKLDQRLEKKHCLSYYEFEYYMQGRFNLEMKRFAEESGVLLFDAVSIFPEDKSPFFIDQIHPNAKGTSLIAKSLYSFLIESDIAR